MPSGIWYYCTHPAGARAREAFRASARGIPSADSARNLTDDLFRRAELADGSSKPRKRVSRRVPSALRERKCPKACPKTDFNGFAGTETASSVPEIAQRPLTKLSPVKAAASSMERLSSLRRGQLLRRRTPARQRGGYEQQQGMTRTAIPCLFLGIEHLSRVP